MFTYLFVLVATTHSSPTISVLSTLTYQNWLRHWLSDWSNVSSQYTDLVAPPLHHTHTNTNGRGSEGGGGGGETQVIIEQKQTNKQSEKAVTIQNTDT